MHTLPASLSFLSLRLVLTKYFTLFSKMKNTEKINKNISKLEVELELMIQLPILPFLLGMSPGPGRCQFTIYDQFLHGSFSLQH